MDTEWHGREPRMDTEELTTNNTNGHEGKNREWSNGWTRKGATEWHGMTWMSEVV